MKSINFCESTESENWVTEPDSLVNKNINENNPA
jgi:hypothetical protein